MLQTDSFLSNLFRELWNSAHEFEALQLIVRAKKNNFVFIIWFYNNKFLNK